MKHIWIRPVALLCLCLVLAGGLMSCTAPNHDNKADGVLRVVCTTYSAYDMARSVLISDDSGKDQNTEILLLGRPGQDMHSYEPSAQDIITLAKADVLISVGDTAEPWIKGALSSANNSGLIRVIMTEVCGIAGEDCHEDHDHEHEHEHNEETDEHVWVSLKNALKISKSIVKAAEEAVGDASKAADIRTRGEAYEEKLTALDQAYTDMVAQAKRKTILIADRYPFIHLMKDYGLTCYAAFPGCSSETEASFATQAELIQTVQTLELPYIFVIDGSDRRVAETVAEKTGAKILLLHSCQVITEADMKAGLSYLDIAESNLESLRKALCE